MGGKFAPGQSGNPGGKSRADKEALNAVKKLARRFTKDAINSLHAIATDTKAEKRARVAAAIAILDRGYGRPGQQDSSGGGIVGGRLVLDFIGRKQDNGSQKAKATVAPPDDDGDAEAD